MPLPAFLLSLWAMLFVSQVLWVLGAIGALALAKRPVATVRIGRLPVLRLRVAGVDCSVGLLPSNWAVAMRSRDGEQRDQPAAIPQLAAWLLPIVLVVVLLGPTLALHHLRTGFDALLDPVGLPERIERFRALLASGALTSAFGILLAKLLVLNLIPLPPTAAGALLYLPLRRSSHENAMLLFVVLSIAFYLLGAIYLLDARWAFQSGPEAVAELRRKKAEREEQLRARRLANEKQERLHAQPLQPQDFASPVLLVSSVVALIGGAIRQVRRHQREVNEGMPELLSSLGYLQVSYEAPAGEPLSPSLSAAIVAGSPFALQRDYHGVRITFTVSSSTPNGAVNTVLARRCWSAPVPHDRSWRLQTKRLDAPPAWLARATRLDDEVLDSRFYFTGDARAFLALIERDPAIRELLLGLGWVSLEVAHGVAEFHDRLDWLVSSMVGGSVGARFISAEEWLQLFGACHEQLAELLARIGRASR